MSPKQSDPSAEPKAAPATAAQAMAQDAATLQEFGFKAMTGMGIAWVEALSDMGSEVLSFVADRIKEDVKTQHRILHCKDAGELQQIQTEFIQTAVEQYSAETGKLVKMSQDMLAAATAKQTETD